MRISDWSSDVCSSDRAQVAAFEAQIGVDHADQRQVGEMIAFGDELGADDDVDVARLHAVDELGGLGGRPDRVRRDDRGPGVGPQRRDLVGDALDAGAARDEAVLIRSEEHTSELQSLMRISYAVFCLKKKKTKLQHLHKHNTY